MTQRPPKKPILEELLREGWVYVHLDPRKPGVEIPCDLKDEMRVVLQIGYDMPVPIPDLVLDEGGIHATLSFSRTPYACKIPWRAVFAMVSNEGRALLWPHDIPQEILALQDETSGYIHHGNGDEQTGAGAGAESRAGAGALEPSRNASTSRLGAGQTVSRKGRQFRVFDGAASYGGAPEAQNPSTVKRGSEETSGNLSAEPGEAKHRDTDSSSIGPGAGTSPKTDRPFLRLVE